MLLYKKYKWDRIRTIFFNINRYLNDDDEKRREKRTLKASE